MPLEDCEVVCNNFWHYNRALTKLFDCVSSPAPTWSLGLSQLSGIAAKQFHDNVIMPLVSAMFNELASMRTVLHLLQDLQPREQENAVHTIR